MKEAFDLGLGIEGASARLSDGLVDALLVAGTPDDCVERIATLRDLARKEGYEEFYLGAPLGPDPREAAELLLTQVVPQVWPDRHGGRMTALVARTDRDGVTQLRLNRAGAAERAVHRAAAWSCASSCASVRDDPAVRVVLLAGAGGSFCAGADLGEFPADATGRAGLARHPARDARCSRQLMELEQPTLAAVNGAAVGAGWGLALACDLCFASADAELRLPEVAKGYRLPAVLVARLVQVVGPVRAARDRLRRATRIRRRRRSPAAGSPRARTARRARRGVVGFATALASRPRHSVAAVKSRCGERGRGRAAPSPELAWTEEMQ